MPGTFRFVDYWSKAERKRWKRVDLQSAIAHQDKLADKPDIFVTVQHWERSAHQEGERHVCPLFFDLDSPSLEQSLEDAQLILQQLTVELEIDPENIVAKFSGSKGFHIIVNPFALGVRPSVYSTQVAKRAALDIAKEMGLKTVDEKVYSSRRMLRIPNSIRSDGKAATMIPADQLIEMTVQHVLDTLPGPVTLEPMDWKDQGRSAEALLWYTMHQDAVEMEATLTSDQQRGFIKKSKGPLDLPVCIKHLLEPRLLQPGSRNNTTFMMAVGLREAGIGQQKAEGMMNEWTKQVHHNETGKEADSRVLQNARSTVRSAFRGDKKPVCRALLGLGTEENKVNCEGTRCPWVHYQKEVEDSWTPPEIPLVETKAPERIGRRVTVQGTICQQDPAPYIVPAEVQLKCSANCDKDTCGAKDGPTVSVEKDARAVLRFVTSGSHDAGHKKLGEWAAKKVRAECKPQVNVTRSMSITNASIQPVLEATYSGGPSSFAEFEAWIPHDTVDSQADYELQAVPLAHPATHQHTLVCLKGTKLSRAHDEFEVTPAALDRLKTMQTDHNPEAVARELNARHAEYEKMHGIVGRRLESIALSLVYHSVLSFRFRGRPTRRGWLECLVVGDTAQGKTELARGFQEYYGVGSFVSGENASLAGLTVGVEQRGNKFQQRYGVYPRNDTGCITIDEIHEMEAKVMRGLSEVRSQGIASMDKIASAKAQARVRGIFLANALASPTDTRSVKMELLDYGCEAVLNVMRTPEDCRRLDFAIGMKKKEELTQRMNSPIELGCDRDQQADQELVLWAWSRKQDQVVFDKGTEDLILRYGAELSDKYYCSVPLVDPGEAKVKIARLSCAVAASVFSSDETGELLIARECHVHAAVAILEQLYRSDDLDLEGYAVREQGRDHIDAEKCYKVANAIHLAVGLTDTAGKGWVEAVLLLRDSEGNVGWTAQDLADALPLGMTEIRAMIRILYRERFIRKRAGIGVQLTNRGLLFARELESWADTPEGIMGRILDRNKHGGTPSVNEELAL